MSLNDLEENVERIYIDMENELLLNIAKKLEAGKPMEIDKWDEKNNRPLLGSGGVNEWQLERLKELNGLNEKNAKIIAKYSGKTLKEVNKVFAKAREIGTEADKGILELGVKAGILNEVNPETEEEVVKGVVSQAIREVLTTFNKQNNSLLASAGQEYTDIVNKVSSQVMAGTKTVGKAMQEAVSQLAEKGLTGFTARNGAKWSPEAYTKMILKTNTQNTINRMQEERLALAGNDYIEISQHSGARPKCADAQGQIFSLSGNTEPIVDGRGKKIKVRSWSSSSYGEPDGILGINCGHSRHAFVPNISIHRNDPIPKQENSKDYKERQRQRQYERAIRNKKREIAMLKEIGAEDDYIRIKTNKLKNYQKEYFAFLDKTGRTRIRGNEWIGTTNLSASQKAKAKKSLSNWQKGVNKKTEIKENFIIKEKEKYKKLTNEEYMKLSKLQDITQKEKGIIINGRLGYVGTPNSFDINKKLREMKLEKIHYKKTDLLDKQQKKVVETLTRVINKNKVPENLFATREVKADYLVGVFGEELKNLSESAIIEVINNKWVGKKIPGDGGFFSCALNDNKVLLHKVKLNVHIPKGTKGFVADNPVESEIILGRNTNYLIMGATLESNTKIVIDILIK